MKMYQIYHVARCGSTLLASLLSNTATTYSEPHWAHTLNGATSIPEDISQFNNSIIKFSSITTSIGFKPAGPKVFLYRPLAQYLYKMNSCNKDWIDNRKQLYGEWFTEIQGTELVLEPDTMMQLHTIFWASCVLEMQKYEDVLWIKSNDFFLDKEGTAKQVLSHFGKEGELEMGFASINVKLLKLNGPDPINRASSYNAELVTGSHGVIKTDQALSLEQINNTVEWAKSNIPVDPNFY